MAVAHDTASESHTGTVASISEASFTWNHPGAASGVDGVLIFIANMDSDQPQIADISYGGVDVPSASIVAVDTAIEIMRLSTYFLGTLSIPQGTQAVVVNRNNNTVELWAVCITVTCSVAGKVGAIHTPGVVLLEGDGTLAQQLVDDGSPGTNSVRYAGICSGLAAFPPTGANSTALHNFDTGNQTAAVVRETTAGQGSRLVGFTSGTSDDRAAVHLAIKEADPPPPEVIPSLVMPPLLVRG